MSGFIAACLLRTQKLPKTEVATMTMTEYLIDTDTTAYNGTAFFPFPAVGEVPTVARTLTFDYGYTGTISTTVNFNPLVVGIVGSSLNVELPLAVSVNEDFQGSFSVPIGLALSTYADILDGDITLDLSSVSSVLGINPNESIPDILADFGITLPNSVVQILDALDITDANSAIGVLDNLFDLELAGDGTLTSVTGTTDFTFNYAGDTNSLEIDGLAPLVVAGSLIGQSTITAEGDFTVDLVLNEFVNLTNLLGIDLPSDVLSVITFAQFAGINELELASGSFDLEVTTVPGSTPVTSSTDLVSAVFANSLLPVSVPT